MLHSNGPQHRLAHRIFSCDSVDQLLLFCRSLIVWSLLRKLWSLICATDLIWMVPRCGWTTAMLRSQLLLLQLLQAQTGSAQAAVQSTSPGGKCSHSIPSHAASLICLALPWFGFVLRHSSRYIQL